jgi:Putative zinc-finger
MRGHVDAESLALYAEGLLSHRRTARVRAHLAGCAECTRTAAALGEVTTRLSQVPAPPLPAAVAAQLDAALSAESAGRAASPGAPAPAPAPRPPRRNPLWSPVALRILAVTGVTLVVGGGIGYAVAQSGPSSTSSGAAAPSANRSAAQAGPNRSPGGPAMHSRFGAPNVNPGGGIATERYVRSDTDYHRKTLAEQAVLVAAKSKIGAVPGVRSLPSGVEACARRIAQHRPVTMIDLARFDQRRAAVILLGGSPGKVIAVSYSCADLDSATLTVTSQPGAG